MSFSLNSNNWACGIPRRFGVLLIAVSLYLALVSQQSFGQEFPSGRFDDVLSAPTADACRCQMVPGDEIWVVNTRNIPESCSDCFGSVPAEVCQWTGADWINQTQEDLFNSARTNSALSNVIYAHGNFTDYGWSLRRGCEVYGSFFRDGCTRGPLRFVIWSWKSERESAFCSDYHIKSHRAVEEGCRLNSIASQLGPKPPIVIGYSLGAQAVLSALSQPAFVQNETTATSVPWRVALIAVALDAEFPPQIVGNLQITNRLEQLVVFTNAKDPALRSSNRLTRRRTHSPPFSQYELLPSLPSGPGTFSQFEVGSEIGRHHAITYYRQSETIRCHIRQLLITETADGSAAPQ